MWGVVEIDTYRDSMAWYIGIRLLRGANQPSDQVGGPPTVRVTAFDGLCPDQAVTCPNDRLVRRSSLAQPQAFAPFAIELILALFTHTELFIPHLFTEAYYRQATGTTPATLIRRSPVTPRSVTRVEHRRPADHPNCENRVRRQLDTRSVFHLFLEYSYELPEGLTGIFHRAV